MLKGLSIRAYLTLMVVLFGVVLLIGAAAGLLSLRESNASLQQMYTVDTPAVADLEGSAGQLLRLRLALATYSSLIELNDQEGADAVLKRFDTYQKVSNERLAHYISKASNDADEQRLIKDMQDKRDAFLHEGAEPALAALKSGDKAAFQQLQAHKLSPLYSAYEKAMLTLEKLQLDHAEQRYQEAQQLFYTISVAVAIGMAATLIFAWLGRMMMVRAIVHPVDATIDQFQRIANGDLTGRIDNVSDNEMGRLAAALRKMQESLIATVNTVRHGTDSIDTGVSEIAAGNTNLSQRTEEQAASLEETAASIEELTSTVKQTADNAKQASSLAQGASTLAAQGGDLTQQVVGTMQKIVDDSRRIADIVGVIEGIAFQTNILALNAAVEAARAGEQGRGFAVVASEVRSLAQRSAAAAKEIKGLIGESNERVTAGADLVQRSGSTMTDIVDAIARVSAIMSEIAEAATEQSTGIDQVNLAVAQMDEVTQQNAALVEQAAAAASSLEEQARRLTTAVAVFRTDSGQASASRGAARRVVSQKQGVAMQMEAVEAV
ncbi:methyl-accepting chemotaxis protein [Paraburkholderia hospita]|jgi:methyl-accepting chemotaxis protein|uniref:HAMP domain-containing protein n=1 Tax=Paraburkholderia hospita TaxID=169430 RepID=A0AAN1MHG5_9BURK|nr:methyl-accepting chemotaxis protein [Paraburkholderia hospita]AUT67239.1 HAMP domain-containing protein [Paraburkholderia hospita]SEH43649.1 methyl-accepting chemotaxis sensory transducer with TarH sensor [Paraburkholderia hospita]SKC45441.1 methyl-accepting chemotaxis sensory transducer with TarH sensor [Paraburkholderia hospita]